MAQATPDSRRQARPAVKADETGFKPVALPALRAAVQAAGSKPARAPSRRDSVWMLHEDALIG
jgi:hypothetical protein